MGSESIAHSGLRNSVVKYRIVYLNVVVHIVTVSNIIPAAIINSGSSMLLTFEIKSE